MVSKTTKIGIALFIVILSSLLFFSKPFSVANTATIQFTQSSTNGIISPSLTSGSFSFSATTAPNYQCVDKTGAIILPQNFATTPSLKVTCALLDDSIAVDLNGASYTLIKNIPTPLDQYVTATYLGSGLKVNNAQGIPDGWHHNFIINIDTSFLQPTFDDTQISTITWKSPYRTSATIDNTYVAVDGNIVILQSSTFARINTQTSSYNYQFAQGKNQMYIDVDTEELLGRDVEIIPTMHLFMGSKLIGGASSVSGTKTYQVTPNGVSYPVINPAGSYIVNPSPATAQTQPISQVPPGTNIVIVPMQQKNLLQNILDSIVNFFAGLFT